MGSHIATLSSVAILKAPTKGKNSVYYSEEIKKTQSPAVKPVSLRKHYQWNKHDFPLSNLYQFSHDGTQTM